MIEPLVDWVRQLNDPLRNAKLARRWIARLPRGDVLEVQRLALELVGNFPGTRKPAKVQQVEALLKLDARLERVIADLTRQYTVNYQKSSTVESRLWHAVFDLVKAFVAAYQHALTVGFPTRRIAAGARYCPGRWCGLPITRASTASSGCSATATGFRRNGANSTSSTSSVAPAPGNANSSRWARGRFASAGVFLEQVYLNTLLLMRLDSGNFTPDQVEWVARQIDEWAPALELTPIAQDAAGFFVDLASQNGLRRREKRPAGGQVLYIDTGRLYARIVERLRWLPERDEVTTPAGELPPREQRLLLMRLASLYGPDAIAHAPRATRYAADEHVRVVSGLHALVRAIAEIDRLPDAARTPGVVSSYDEATLVNPGINPASIERRVRGSRWKMADRSETGFRLMAPAKEAPARLGELLAVKDDEYWTLGVVRRMQRQQVDEMTVGVQIVARRLVRVLMRGWAAPVDVSRGVQDRPFFGIYLPAVPENRQVSQRSLIGPDDRFSPGGMVELDTGSARYLIRLTNTLERQTGWTWTSFNAVRKLGA